MAASWLEASFGAIVPEMPLALPTTTLSHSSATVVATRISYDAPVVLRDAPITTITLRDSNGATREVRILGGPNHHGGYTWLAETAIPSVGAMVPNDVRAWVRGDPPATWPAAKIPVSFTFQLADPKGLGASAFPEFDVARRAWSRASCTAWRASLAPRANVTGADDGINAVIWHDDAWPAELVTEKLGQVVLSTDAAGDLEDVDVHINGADYTWSMGGSGDTVDARGVYEHELGHALGLGHSSDITATMYAGDPGGEAWRSLEQDDFDGVCALYPGVGDLGCESGPACPTNYVCIAHNCERLGETDEVCSPCDRVVGACAGAGSNARCIDIGSGLNSGRVCGRACSTDADCGGDFHCQATTSSGDFQCVASDACASGPDPCKTDADCNNDGVCKSGACVGVVPPDETDGGSPGDASVGDGGSSNDSSASGGCSCATAGNATDDFGGKEFSIGAIMIGAMIRRRKKRMHSAGILAVLLGLSGLGCQKDALAPASSPEPTVETNDVDDGGAVSCRNIVPRIDSISMWSGKPPLRKYTFDIRLKNPANDARWLILPETFPYDGKDEPGPGKGAVSGLEVSQMSARGRLIWISMGDPGGFHAVLLPAHATVTLHNLTIDSWWNTVHKTGKVEVILAKSISIDEKPIAGFVTGDLKSDTDAEAQMEADPRNLLKVDKALTGIDAHAVTFDEECRGFGQAVLKTTEN